MNPGQRFGQLEEIMAEMLQKQDRLETLATKTFAIAENADAEVKIVNKKVDNLDAKLSAKIDNIDAKVDNVDARLSAKIDNVDAKVETVARALANLTIANQVTHQQMNDRNEELHQQTNDKLDSIMTFLKEKFS